MADEKRVLQALVSLEGNPDFKIVTEWIKDRRDEARNNDSIKDDCILRWKQGRAQEGSEILDMVKNARSNLLKMK